MALVVLKSAAYVFLRSMQLPTSTAVAVFAMTVSLCACGQPVPIRVLAEADNDGDHELVAEAFDILGLPFETTALTAGTVHLGLYGQPEDVPSGRSLMTGRRCVKVVMASRHPSAIAHEIGHALGLEHICEAPCPDELADNLMNGEAHAGEELLEEQIDELDRGRRRLTRCR